MRTTLNKIRKHQPCKEGWERLLRHLNKKQPDDEPLPLEEILDSNGFSDALWCLRAVEGHDREMRLYAVWCARQVQRLMTDPRSVAALDVTERYARGQASREELMGARAARAESAAVAWAESAAAAWEAAWEARAESAAWAARAAAAAAARAARAESAAVAWEAERAAAAARAAAEAATRAAIDAQATEFRRLCREIDSGRDPYPLEAKP